MTAGTADDEVEAPTSPDTLPTTSGLAAAEPVAVFESAASAPLAVACSRAWSSRGASPTLARFGRERVAAAQQQNFAEELSRLGSTFVQ